MKSQILKLNASFAPIGTAEWRTVMVDIISGSAFPVDISYEIDENGYLNKNRVEWFNVVRSFDEWSELPIREWDEYVTSVKKTYRLPPIVVCSKFNKIIHKRILFPTKANIWARDNYTCGYTGKKLSKENCTVDHVIPSSRGGGNTWENLITCEKTLNIWKSDRTPKECGLKLLWKPTKPKNGMIYDSFRTEWLMFLEGGNFS